MSSQERKVSEFGGNESTGRRGSDSVMGEINEGNLDSGNIERLLELEHGKSGPLVMMDIDRFLGDEE